MGQYPSCFISYGQPDYEIAVRINDFLKSHGIRTWAWYEQRRVGEWRPQIQKALDDHDYIILVVSKRSLERAGVQDENRLALADDIRPYAKRLLPILVDDVAAISSTLTSPEGKELLNFVKRVLSIRIYSRNGPRFTNQVQKKLLAVLEKQVTKILVIGSVSVEKQNENERKRSAIHKLARSIGKYIALHESKPICLTTLGGGIDFVVCEGFQNSVRAKEAEGRLWLYPEAQDRIFYNGPGRRVELDNLPDFEGKSNLIPLDSRGRILISKMAADADSVIAIRGGRGIEYAFIICLAEKKRFVCIPMLGGMSAKLFQLYNGLPNIIAPEMCMKTPASWDAESFDAERIADQLVACALQDC
jgi:hypothetical protein